MQDKLPRTSSFVLRTFKRDAGHASVPPWLNERNAGHASVPPWLNERNAGRFKL